MLLKHQLNQSKMKKVVNVNLAGKAFTIDEDAYSELSQYLNKLSKYFSRSQGAEDILYDIETRIAELFEEEESGGPIISIARVEKIKQIMGSPIDFEDEDNYSSNHKKKSSRQKSSHHNNGQKRFFRDPEDKVIGGVASGLAAYLGIGSALVMRIIFISLFLFFGFGLIPYLILWALVPEAKSSSDFLSMKGEEVNIDNIAKTVEEGIQDLADKIEDLGKNLKTKIL